MIIDGQYRLLSMLKESIRKAIIKDRIILTISEEDALKLTYTREDGTVHPIFVKKDKFKPS